MRYHLLPRFIQFEVTYDCNGSCVFCYNPSRNKTPNFNITKMILRQLNEYRIEHIQLTGGEVTLISALKELLYELPEVNCRSIVTNGLIYRPDIVDMANEIYVSLHGPEAIHNLLTRKNNGFKKTTQTIQRYVSSGIRVYSDTIVTSVNADNLYETAKIAAGLGMQKIFVNIFQEVGLGQNPDGITQPTIHQLQDSISQLLSARDNLNIGVEFGTSTPFCIDERLTKEGLGFKCGIGDWFAAIDPYGNFRICNHSTKSYGNILKIPLHKIWHSGNINCDYRNAWPLFEPCASCTFLEECGGGCRVDHDGNFRIDPLINALKVYNKLK